MSLLHEISVDSLEDLGVDEGNVCTAEPVIATCFPASLDAVNKVLEMVVGDDGRSDFQWIRLCNGDLILGVFPHGDGYFAVEPDVEADYRRAKPPLTTPR